ncbi:MAG: hypothetical protein HY247_04045 [archaeon]|nr:MAG: hypothetical protein HY247_04045 [archaeon]
METTESRLSGILEQRERGFLLEKVRVKLRSSLENIDVGDFRIEKLNEGETAELPRWVADELVKSGLAEMPEEPFESEMVRSLSREKMMGPLQLPPLPHDFYVKMKRRLAFLREAAAEGRGKKEDYEKVRAGSYDLIGLRLSKLLALSSSATPASVLADKLTPEEVAFFSLSQSISKDWRGALLDGAK